MSMIETGDISQAASMLGKLSAEKRKLNPEKYRKQQQKAAKRPRPNALGKPKPRKQSTDQGWVKCQDSVSWEMNFTNKNYGSFPRFNSVAQYTVLEDARAQ